MSFGAGEHKRSLASALTTSHYASIQYANHHTSYRQGPTESVAGSNTNTMVR